MHFMDIRCAQSWLDDYNKKGHVAESENREIIIKPYGSHCDAHAHVDMAEWRNYIYSNYCMTC